MADIQFPFHIFFFNGPRTLGLMQLMGLWLLRVVNRVVGLGIGLGGNPLLLTKLCKDGEKHWASNSRVGDGAGDTGMKSMRFGRQISPRRCRSG